MRRKLWVAASGAVALVAALLAGGTAQAGPCVTDTLADYIALGSGGCTINDKTFSSFFYTPSASGTGAVTTDTTSVTVMPTKFGFIFNPVLSSGGNGFADVLMGYTVATTDSALLIDDASLSMVGGVTGPGAFATVDENVCLNGSPSTCLGLHVAEPSPISDHITFSPVALVTLLKDLHVKSDGEGGSASISGIFNDVSQVPEPASLTILAIGLIGLGVYRRRARKA